VHTGFWWRNLRDSNHLEAPVIDGRIILSGIGGMDWIDLTEDRDMCRALANVVMNLQVPNSAGNFFTS
jgi:hypothetical protein